LEHRSQGEYSPGHSGVQERKRRSALLHQEEGPQAVIFDFDLTLADSTKAVEACIAHGLAGLGLPAASPGAVRKAIGLSLEATLETLTGSRDPNHQVRFRELFVQHADRVMVAQTEFLDGSLGALAELQAQGLRLAIVSTKYRYRIEAILERHRAGHFFEMIVGGEDAANHKPHPEGLRLALRKLGISGATGSYVGDHLVDAEAAMAAGVPFFPVLTGATSREDFERFPHVEILESVSSLPAYLSELTAWPPAKAMPTPSP
jgi:phosphoglycolate phosphatase